MTTKQATPATELSAKEPVDDIDAYIATLSQEERDRLPIAEAALDLAIMLYRARDKRGLSQTAAAELAGFHQQTVSRLERAGGQPQLNTLQRYLYALGYTLELNLVDNETGETIARVPMSQSSAAD